MKISKKDYDNTTDYLLNICKKASNEILNIYKEDFTFENKDDSSPLTIADTNANKIIVDALKTKFSSIDIISEENKENKLAKDNFFLVDPLDGTKEFIKRNGEFTVNIAYLENKKPIIGVICVPAKNLFYYTNGHESFKSNSDGKIKKIIGETNTHSPSIVTSRSHLDDKTLGILNKIKNKKILKMGSSIKFCLIAEGKANLYFRFGNTMEWDVAAGHAILKNANSYLTDLNFDELKYGKKGFLNPPFIAFSKINKKFIETIRKHIANIK